MRIADSVIRRLDAASEVRDGYMRLCSANYQQVIILLAALHQHILAGQ